MNTSNDFKRALAEGRPQIGMINATAPYVSELVAGCGFDRVLPDTKHTPTDVPLILQQLQAVDTAGLTSGHRTWPVVRPAWNDTVLIKRYLDVGAKNLSFPFVQNAAETAAAVAATRFAPDGVRGMRGSDTSIQLRPIRELRYDS